MSFIMILPVRRVTGSSHDPVEQKWAVATHSFSTQMGEVL